MSYLNFKKVQAVNVGPEILIMATCALGTVILGGFALFQIGSQKSQTRGAQHILMKRVFQDTETVSKELNSYFDKLLSHHNEALVSFVLTLVILLFLFQGLASKAIVLLLFIVPLSVLVITRREMLRRRKEFTDQLSDE